MRFSDTMLGVLLVAFGLAIGLYSQSFPDIPGQKYGAAVFPVVIAIGFAACGGILLLSGLRSAVPTPLITRTEWTRKRGALPAILITVACIVGYVLLAQRVGFIPLAIVILLVLLRMLRISWPRAVFYAVATAFLCDFVFRSLLLVPLPFGMLPRLPW